MLYEEVGVPQSPFRVMVMEGCDPSRVRAYGPGLEEGLVNKPNRFTVETRYPEDPVCMEQGGGGQHSRGSGAVTVINKAHTCELK